MGVFEDLGALRCPPQPLQTHFDQKTYTLIPFRVSLRRGRTFSTLAATSSLLKLFL